MEENKSQLNDKNLKVLRTYTSDMADAVKTNEVSVIKIALAEKEKREREEIYKEAEGTNTSKIFLVIGGIILIAGAIIGSYFLIQKKKANETPKIIKENIDTFISYDSYSKIDTTNITNVNDLVKIINQESQTNTGSIKSIFFTKKTNEISEDLTSKNFLSLINSTAPGALIRSLSDKYLLGKYSSPKIINENSKPSTFLIFQTSDYALSYASMLNWEQTMLKDLFIIFNINIQNTNNSVFEQPWKDILINNKDTRVLYGEDGKGILYYVFVGKNNLIITDNTETIKEITSRIMAQNTKSL